MWVCSKCEHENSDNLRKCIICETEKPLESLFQEAMCARNDKIVQNKNSPGSFDKSPKQMSHNESASTAIVFGIVGMILSWLPIFGLVLSIIGLIISRSNRKFAEVHGFKENNINTAGYVTSWVGLILGIITIIIFVIYMIFISSDISRYIVLPEIM